MRALVTGHRGFVGRHITTALVERGYDVYGVDLKDEAVMLGASNLTSWAGDCRDYLKGANIEFDLVVHCAAVVGGRTMIDGEPLRLAAEDLSIDAELFRWALRTRPKRMVLFSSSAAYPTYYQKEWGAQRLTEGDICLPPPGNTNSYTLLTPDATYGWVKLTLELLAAEANALGIRTHVFRPFSGYGSDQDESYPFPAIMRRAIEHVQRETAQRAMGSEPEPFHVWGHPLSTRDWVHIDDVVGCVLAHVDADEIGPVNICTGWATSFVDLARWALLAAGSHMRGSIVGDTAKPMGVFHRVGDPTAMSRVYTPTITIEEGIARAMKELR